MDEIRNKSNGQASDLIVTFIFRVVRHIRTRVYRILSLPTFRFGVSGYGPVDAANASKRLIEQSEQRILRIDQSKDDSKRFAASSGPYKLQLGV